LITLSAERYGLIARLDLLEGEGQTVTPVDYKRGGVPDTPERSWEADRVQLCVQALILRENSYTCTEGYLYYAESRERVRIPIDAELVTRTLSLLEEARRTAEGGVIPPPLVDSPKCPRCSLVGICLPDEVRYLVDGPVDEDGPRRLVPARDDALPVYVSSQGMTVGKSGDRLEIKERGKLVQEVRMLDVSQLCLFGNVQVTTQAQKELLERGAAVCYFTYGGWFYGMATGPMHKNVELRRNQYAAAADEGRSLSLAARFVEAKIKNSRTLLRRNGIGVPDEALDRLADLAKEAVKAESQESLLGLEGLAARIYFSQFSSMLKPKGEGAVAQFDFTGRNRRPPRDPVNAMLSYAYSLLAKDFTVTAQAVGLDPYLGFYHQPRYGRPSLALDLMEEFRPLIGDSVVIGLINNGEITSKDFISRGGAWSLTPEGRRTFLTAYDRRMDQLVTHPLFGYSISYRRILEVQVRLLGRHLAGELAEYPQFLTR
jgi:CRISPR-associated protein Cas1